MAKIKELNRTQWETSRGNKINVGVVRMPKVQRGYYIASVNHGHRETKNLTALRCNTGDNLHLYTNRYFPVFDKVKKVYNITGIGEVIVYHKVLSEKGRRRLKKLRNKREKN